MSKTKKQITNEKRTRRLGTGEGIARTRPAPRRRTPMPSSWALIATAIVVALVVIGVVVALTRSGGGGGGGGQQSSVVQSRLSHAKLDPLSSPTWQPNYTNLSGALAALDLPGPSDVVTHYHVHLTLFVNGREVAVPSQIGISPSALSPLHTHDDSGVLHIEADTPNFHGTLQQFFDVWGVYLSPQCLGGYCSDVKMWVNGKPSTAFGSLVLQRHQQITIAAGSIPQGFKPPASYKFPAGE